MDIIIKVIPNSEHRPNITGADWYFDQDGNLQVRVSKMGNWKYEVCLALHEVFEAVLCKDAGVTQQQVDEFDIPYEATHSPKCDAGDEKDAPYNRQHGFATAAERIMTTELRVNWLDYNKVLETF